MSDPIRQTRYHNKSDILTSLSYAVLHGTPNLVPSHQQNPVTRVRNYEESDRGSRIPVPSAQLQIAGVSLIVTVLWR
ncbi:unnamed protein product [Calypogeia fissa]